MRVFLLISLLFVLSSTKLRLSKKSSDGQITFHRVQKYTNKSQPRIGGPLRAELSLDVLMIADFSSYQAFIEMAKGDDVSAQHFASQYLTAIFEQMRIVYNDINFNGETLQLSMAGALIAYREEDCPLWATTTDDDFEVNLNETVISTSNSSDSLIVSNETTSGTTKLVAEKQTTTLDDLETNFNSTDMTLQMDAKEAIDRLTTWVKQHAGFLPKHDHAILITKFDLLAPNGHSATQGMAYVGNVCQLGDSSSVVEDIGASATALIAAHELGHSLGAVHDGGREAASCDSNDNFLMASAVSGSHRDALFRNSRTMSNCSIESIMNNFNKPSVDCIRKWRPVHQNRSRVHSDFSKKPGETISLHQQCQIAFGPHFGSCLNEEYYHGKSLCRRVWCKDRRQKRTEPCQTMTYFPALDGTECGHNTWCIAGECVPNPKKWIDCTDLNAKTCAKYSKSKLKHYCKAKQFQGICCRTCATLPKGPAAS